MNTFLAAAPVDRLEALLFEPLLRPLESAFGEYGEFAKEAFATALARAFERQA